MSAAVMSAPASLATNEPLTTTTSSAVTATLVNPYAVELADLRVTAVAFDAADHIIGGGVTILDLLPAGGNAAVTVPVTVGGEPARVEVFAVVDGLAAIGE